MHVPLVVLGGGPGGYAAAFRAADGGCDVALVDQELRLGGTCLLRGCIPSKSLLAVGHAVREAERLRDVGIDVAVTHIDTARLAQHQAQLVERLSKGLNQLAKRRRVRQLVAKAMFQDAHTLRLEGDHPSLPADRILTFDHAIIATGSRVSLPAAWRDLPRDRIWTSREALAVPDLPRSLLVVGGGYIGLELATAFAHLGSRVTVVEALEQILSGVDRDLVKPLARSLAEICAGGVHVHTQVVSLRPADSHVEVELEDAEGKKRRESFERVLLAVGRKPHTAELGLENTRVVRDERGFILHDNQMRTAEPNLFAIGDAAGEPMLAHKAIHEGRLAAEVVLGEEVSWDAQAIPAVVFTDPEIAWAGWTEAAAKEAAIPYEVATYPWAASGRAQANRDPRGLTKWLAEPDSGRILGCGIVGTGAGELIGEAVVAIEAGLVLKDIAASIHPHPTLSETLGHAADVFAGTATEIYKPKSANRRR